MTDVVFGGGRVRAAEPGMAERADDRDKKLLILGGAAQHCKLVKAAKERGAIVYVADYLPDSPAKKIADKAVDIDIFDVDALCELCVSEEIDGVAAAWLDPCQVPYVEVCERMGFPCYGNRQTVALLTNKAAFKACCEKHGVGVIPYMQGLPNEVLRREEELEFPVYVKPSVSRGSRAQAICESHDELASAVHEAAVESKDGRVIVEKYMGEAHDISITYFFVDGTPHLERISDRILGQMEDGLSNVAIGCVSPSMHATRYFELAHERVVAMLKEIGCMNGPVFMQGFTDGAEFYFYDPGMRFPGGDYELAVKERFGIDYAVALVDFALEGEMRLAKSDVLENVAFLGGDLEIIHDISLKSGTISSVCGMEELSSIPGVVSVSTRYSAGDTVPEASDVSRRFAEINYIAPSIDAALSVSEKIQSLVVVSDSQGDMKISPMDQGLKCWHERRRAGSNG